MEPTTANPLTGMTFEDYFKRELEQANKDIAEQAGDDTAENVRKMTEDELCAEMNPATGEPFIIFGVSRNDVGYRSRYAAMMEMRFDQPFQFWSMVMMLPMPVKEMEYLVSKGILKIVPTEPAEIAAEEKQGASNVQV